MGLYLHLLEVLLDPEQSGLLSNRGKVIVWTQGTQLLANIAVRWVVNDRVGQGALRGCGGLLARGKSIMLGLLDVLRNSSLLVLS